MQPELLTVPWDDLSSRKPLLWRVHPEFRYIQVCWFGQIRKRNGRILIGGITDGYRCISLKNADGRRVKKYFHVLVAETFIPNPHNYPFVLHKDDNRLNCRVDNLVWGTQSQNMLQMHDTRRRRRGEQILIFT